MKALYLLFFLAPYAVSSKPSIPTNRYEILSGVRREKNKKVFWDKKYRHISYVYGKTPANFLANNYHYIPAGGKVLDLGMGEGRNAVFLARKGYKVVGIDISSVAIQKAKVLAREFGVRITNIVASLDEYSFPPRSMDAIICFYYINRNLHKKMLSWLRPGGILIYESHTDKQNKKKDSEHYAHEYLLRPSELLTMFKNMRVLKYEEPIHLKHYRASIILQKGL